MSRYWIGIGIYGDRSIAPGIEATRFKAAVVRLAGQKLEGFKK